MGIWVSSINFYINDIACPPQPQVWRMPKLNLIFHDSTRNDLMMMTSTASIRWQPLWPQKSQKCKRFRYWVVFLASATLTASFCGIDHKKSSFSMIFGTLSFRGCGGQPLALVWNIWVKSQMHIAPEHAFKEKSTKSLILLPLRTIYNHTFQCETPCSWWWNRCNHGLTIHPTEN
jgi:hypothetical protein